MFAPIVESVLRAEVQQRRDAVRVVDPRLLPQVDALAGLVLSGGKRFRPRFLWCGWRAGAGPDTGSRAGQVARVGAALELLQAGALAHDDIIDNSATRRGRPSLHVAVGTGEAILLGDLALAWADDLFVDACSQLGVTDDEVRFAWRDMRGDVLVGQLLDLQAALSSVVDPVVQARDARRVNRYKTAAYTVERPLQLGALLAGASERVITALRAYGAHVGLAFQLRDDLLGVFGSSELTGKPAGDDLVEGKRTVLLALTRQRIDDRPELLQRLDSGLGDATRVDELRELIADSGAVELVEDEIAALTTSGLAALDDAPLTDAAVTELRELADLATVRSR